jgi:aspartate/methionine/tyrosine aminotransferase
LKVQEAKKLARLAEKHGIALISDEVFMTYPAADLVNGQVRSLIGHDEILSFSLNGLSKAAGMPQMKLGWIAVNGPATEVASALTKLELLLDNYLSVATPVQYALGELLAIGAGIQTRIAARLRENREALSALKDSPIEALTGEGGWSAILQVPSVRTEEDWISKLLTDEGVVVQPGYFYDMAKEAFVVLSLITRPTDFAEGLQKLKHLALRC